MVRELERTMEDAQLLAECINAWNEDDSWLGGFTGGIKLTAEMVYERWIEKDSVFKQYVVEYEGKIAGYVSLDFSPQGEDVMYVPLLGVAPKYQKRGFGKKLLLKTIEKTIGMGKQRLDLHTWAGNLRAMPLYKRTGFIWYPETSAHMMNFIPGILNQELFAELIGENWYDAFQPSITQAPDKMEFEGIEGFIYQFGINDGTLRVFVDAHAQRICGYEIIDENGKVKEKILAKTIPHRLYKGFLIPRSIILVENMRKETLELEVQAKGKEGILEPLRLEEKRLLPPKTKDQIGWEWRPKPQPMISYEDEPSFRTWSRYDIQTRINGKTLSLGTGARVLRGLDLKPLPSYFSNSRKEGITGEIELRNLTSIALNGEISLLLDGKEIVSPKPCKIASYERAKIVYSIPPDMIRERITTLEILFKQSETGSTIREETRIGTPINNEPVAYIIPYEGYVLENSFVKVIGRTYVYPEIEEFVVKGTGIRHTSIFLAMVGLPWNYDNSEFYEQPDEIEVKHEDQASVIKFWKTSKKEKPGIRLETRFILRSDSDLLEVQFGLANTGKNTHKVAIKTGTFSRARNPRNRVYDPNSNCLITNDDQRFYSFAGKDELTKLKQGWISISTPEGLGRGLVSDERVWAMGDASTRGTIMFESKEIELSPNESFEFPGITFVPVAPNPMRMISLWQAIRTKEGKLNAEQNNLDQFKEAICLQIRSDLEKDGLPVALQKEVKVQVRNNTGLRIMDFKIHDGRQWRQVNIAPFDSVEIPYFQDSLEHGWTELTVRTRWQAVLKAYKVSFFYLPQTDEQGKWGRQKQEGVPSFELKNRFWVLKSSSHGMTLHSIEASGIEWLNSFFPEIKPFSHLDQYVGGASASIRATSDSKYGRFLLNSPESRIITIGEWEIIEYFGKIEEPKSIFGLKYIIRYKAHASLPILLIDAEVANPFDTPVDVSIPIIISFNPELVMVIREEGNSDPIELSASSSGSLLSLSPRTMIQLRSLNQDRLSIVCPQNQGKMLASTISSDSLLIFYSKEERLAPGGNSCLSVAFIKH